MSSDTQETGISLRVFVISAGLVVIAAFAAVWYMFPGPDSRQDVVSPSGAVRIELGELCADVGCSRVAILDKDGLRSGCPLAIPGNQPLFAQLTPTWAADESSVDLAYVSAAGDTGSVTLELSECTLTE